MTDNILAKEKISTLFIKYAVPAVIAMVISGSQSIIDGVFLGNYVGPNALAGANMVQPFMQVIIGTSMVVSSGALSIIGRNLGKKKIAEARNTYKTAFILLLILSIMISFIGIFFSESIARFLKANDVLLPYVSSYIRTISFFAPFMSMMFLNGFANRVMGNPSLYLKATVLSLVFNVTLDFTFIKMLYLGVTGAALATGISYTAAFVIVIIPMFRKDSLLNIRSGKFTPSVIKPAVFNGSSEAVVSIASAVTAFVFNSTFMNIAGESGVAAFSTINYIAQFGTLVMFGISDGISAILSYNYGAGKKERLFSTLKLSTIVNVIVGTVLFFILTIFGRELVSMFVKDNPQVISLASNGARLYAFAFLLCGFNIIGSGYFTALGNALESIIIASSRGIIFIVIGINLLPSIFGINGVWLTLPFAELGSFIISSLLIFNKNKELETIKNCPL